MLQSEGEMIDVGTTETPSRNQKRAAVTPVSNPREQKQLRDNSIVESKYRQAVLTNNRQANKENHYISKIANNCMFIDRNRSERYGNKTEQCN